MPTMQQIITVLSLVTMAFLSACVTTKSSPFDANVSVDKEIESRIQVAITYLQEDEPEQALAQMEIAIEKKPKSARVHEILGLALARTGEFDLAETHFKKMLKYDSKYTRGRSNYAGFLISKERYQDAQEQLLVVVDDIYYPKRAVAFWQLAFISKKQGKQDEVEKYLLRAVGLDTRFAAAHLELAQLRFEQEEYAQSYKSLMRYRQNVKQSSAKSLLLGIKLARIFEDKNEEASFVLALKNLYPKSQEYLEYLKDMS